MKRMLALAFIYKNKEYSALVSVKSFTPKIILRVTIMNGDLERLLFGYGLFEYANGDPDIQAIASLQRIISDNIREHLRSNPELISNRFFTAFS
jgi:hypothetical protein